MHAVFVHASQHPFGGDDMFTLLDYMLPSVWLFVAALWNADAAKLLQVSLKRVS